MERKRLASRKERAVAKGKGKNWGGKRKGSGRPPGSVQLGSTDERAAFGKMCRAFTDYALAGVKALCDDKKCPHAVRLQGYFGLLDRGFGKPPQAHEVYGLGGSALVGLNITQELLDQLDEKQLDTLEQIVRLVGGGTGRDTGEPEPEEAREGSFAATVGYSGRA